MFEPQRHGRGLHPFGQHVHTQAQCQRDDAAHDGCIVRVVDELTHEGVVDLDRVKLETAQVGKAGIPRAKVVNGQLDAQGLELAQHTRHSLTVVQQGALRQLKLQLGGRNSGHHQRILHLLLHHAALKLPGRQVDRHHQLGVPRVVPLPQL